MGAPVQRHKKLLPFYVGYMLLYGRHSCVTWTAEWKCTVEAKQFAETIGISTFTVRRCIEFLKKHRYIVDYSWGHGWVAVELRPPIDRKLFVKEAS